jgi:hypothetical protein
MNQIQRFSASFTVVLLVGGLLFVHQSRRLDELRGHSESPALARRSNPSPTGSTPPVSTAPSSRPKLSDADTAAAFVKTFKEKLTSTIEPEAFSALLGNGGRFERICSVAKLTDAERAIVEKQLVQFDAENARLSLDSKLTPDARATALFALKTRRNEWLEAQLGKERAEAIKVSDQAKKRADAQERAALAVSLISGIARLSAAQKDELFKGLVERDLQPSQAEPMIEQQTYGKIEMEPPIPDLTEEAAKILTPDQLQASQRQLERSNLSLVQQQKLITKMMEAIQPALEDMLQSNP